MKIHEPLVAVCLFTALATAGQSDDKLITKLITYTVFINQQEDGEPMYAWQWPENNITMPARQEFCESLIELARSGQVRVYRSGGGSIIDGTSIDLTRPVTTEEADSLLFPVETMFISDMETGEETTQTYTREVTWAHVQGIRFYEAWTMEQETGEIKKEICAYAPEFADGSEQPILFYFVFEKTAAKYFKILKQE